MGQCLSQVSILGTNAKTRSRRRLTASVPAAMASTIISIGPPAPNGPFGDLELVTYEATFNVTQTRTSTGSTQPVATVTIRSTEFNFTDNPSIP
jgi:hypothetical protein